MQNEPFFFDRFDASLYIVDEQGKSGFTESVIFIITILEQIF